MKQVQNDTHEIHQISNYRVFCRYSLSAILYLFFPHSILSFFFSFRIMDDFNDYLRLRLTFSIHLSMPDLLEATYFILDHDFTYNYLLNLIEDMRIAMSYDIISNEELILVEIHKHP